MKKTIEVTVPTSWSAVPFKKYLSLQRDLEDNKGDELAQEHFLFYHLTGMTPDILSGLDTNTYTQIKSDLWGFLGQADFELKRIIEVEGIKYGFEPNLAKMAYGAYLDLSSYKDLQLNEDWKDIMTILYRPLTTKVGELYEIEKYSGFKAWEVDKWDEVGMDIHFGCFFLFRNILKDLQVDTLKSLKNQVGTLANGDSISERSGEVINRLHTLQETVFSTLPR